MPVFKDYCLSDHINLAGFVHEHFNVLVIAEDGTYWLRNIPLDSTLRERPGKATG